MAKLVKMSTAWTVVASVLQLTVEARANDAPKDAAPIGKFTRELNLDTIVPSFSTLSDVAQEALSFGLFTALRNSTGSCDDLDEAQAAIDARLEAWAAGDWGASRESSSVPFTVNHLLCKAVEFASKGAQTAAQAAEKLNAMVYEGLAEAGIPSFSGVEAPERNKTRKACVDQILKNKPAIAAAYATLEARRAAEAAERKARAAAAAASGTDVVGGDIL